MINLEPIESWARERFERKNSLRELALSRSRELTRICARTIRCLHRQEFDEAAELLREARRIGDQMSRDLSNDLDLYYAGYVQDALKELVEATATLRLVRGEGLPSPVELGIAPPAFLNGLGEAVGELRRFLLDRLRAGETERCESLMSYMDEIYGLLITMDYPDALTSGLRRTTDVVRGIVEKTRGDLTLSLRQDTLEGKLARLEDQLQSLPQAAAAAEQVDPPAKQRPGTEGQTA